MKLTLSGSVIKVTAWTGNTNVLESELFLSSLEFLSQWMGMNFFHHSFPI